MYPAPEAYGGRKEAASRRKVSVPRICPYCGRGHRSKSHCCSKSAAAKKPVRKLILPVLCPQCLSG
jgi:hypothetical protein